MRGPFLVGLLFGALTVGQVAPDFTLPDQHRKTVHLAAERGHKVVLVFYRGYW